MKFIVVGAGLAALTCAKVLSERDAEVVFEASDGVGGRVPTEEKESLLLYRGFQMYLTTYPVATRYLNHEAVNLKPFDPGAIVRWGREESVLSDPGRDPTALVPSLLSDAATFSEKLHTLKLTVDSFSERAEAPGELNDR